MNLNCIVVTYKSIIEKHPELKEEILLLQETKNRALKHLIIFAFCIGLLVMYAVRGVI